jgi:hypothetical protein
MQKKLSETIPMFIHGIAFTISDVKIVQIKYGRIQEQMTLTEKGWVFADSPNHRVLINHDDFDHIMIGWSKVFYTSDHGLCVMTVITSSSTITYRS